MQARHLVMAQPEIATSTLADQEQSCRHRPKRKRSIIVGNPQKGDGISGQKRCDVFHDKKLSVRAAPSTG